MLYREIKKSGDQLSILGFGCMRLPQKKGSPGDGKIDEERAKAQIRMAIDQGVNYLDTAYMYHAGASEPFLAKALSDGYREKVYLATKLPYWLAESIEDMDNILNMQLKRLKTSQIDYYLIHGINKPGWDKVNSIGITDFFDQAKADGRIANTGFSFHGEEEAFPIIIDAYDWDICQIQYNYLDENYQAGKKGLEHAASKGVGVIVMEPLRGGLLAQKPPEEVEIIWDEAEEKHPPVEWALRWLWNHPEVTVVLSGMNDEDHIKENLQIAEKGYPDNLKENDLKLIKKVENKYRTLMKIACTGCNYCMPCPYGVDIPTCFEAYNHKHMYGDSNWASLFYLIRLSGALEDNPPGLASQCQACGKCLEICPQNIAIPDLLQDVSNEMEDKLFSIKVWVIAKYNRFLQWKVKRCRRN